ncbi:unnamed protein product [Rhodiola kirilowii]
MALLRALTRRTSLISLNPSTIGTLDSFENDVVVSFDSGSYTSGFFRSFFHSRAPQPSILSLPINDRLRDRLKEMSEPRPRLNLDSVLPPSPPSALKGFSVTEARKLLRLSQAARLKSALREIPGNAIAYSDYVRLCVEKCGGNEEQGREFANLMDASGDVIVLGNVVFTRPEQVVEKMADFVSQSIASPNDPRKKELDQMEKQKAIIDKKACSQVRVELYCGLGFIVLQTLGFMRLTFWELSWDVMEPICYFVTSLNFAAAYSFFLRTSTEPSFEGFFKRRVEVRQRKLMKAEGFDLEKYEQLCKVLCYNCRSDFAEQWSK